MGQTRANFCRKISWASPCCCSRATTRKWCALQPCTVHCLCYVLTGPPWSLVLLPAHVQAQYAADMLHIQAACAALQEFLRIGYYVNCDYADDELKLNPPGQPKLDLLERSILAETPRVTKFPCAFDQPEAIPSAQPADAAMQVLPPAQSLCFIAKKRSVCYHRCQPLRPSSRPPC